MSGNAFHIDVCIHSGSESLPGYPKYATNEARAHAMAEQAVCELQHAGDPGEYLVMVSLQDRTLLGTQVVVVQPPDAFRASSPHQ